MSQNDRVRQYMEDFGSITTLEAFKDLGITRLSARIKDLRDSGFEIEGEWVSAKNRYGDKVKYMRYKIS